nr:MAG TPA: hypothetical protein [Caudoviricetes sp.]
MKTTIFVGLIRFDKSRKMCIREIVRVTVNFGRHGVRNRG